MLKLLFPTAILLFGSFSSFAANDYSLDQAAQKVQKNHGGRVLSAKQGYSSDGHSEYQIRILTNKGQVRRYRVDPNSGNVSKNKRKK